MSYIDSRQFDLNQELAAERAAGYGTCPKCGGYPDMDEDGKYYTCFFCCDTGSVPMAVVKEWERDETDAREYQPLRPVVGGKHVVQRYDDESGEGWDEWQPLLPLRQILPRVWRALNPPIDIGDDDIPF